MHRSVIAGVVGAVLMAVSPGASALSTGRLFWTNNGTHTIGTANYDGSGVNESFLTADQQLTGTAVDASHVYWTVESNPGTIGVANLDGTSANPNLIAVQQAPAGIALDASHIYWANINGGAVGRANLDGTSPTETFVTGASAPFDVAVDGQHIYWADFAASRIGRANLDGTGVNASFITSASQPMGVAVDRQHIYWSNTAAGTIGRANLDGTGVNQNFIIGAGSPQGVAADGAHVYWANVNGNTIGRANLDGTGINVDFITGASGPSYVAVLPPVPPTAHASPGSLTFPSQAEGSVSSPQTVSVSNVGGQPLSVAGFAFAGTNPGDYFVGSSTCGALLAPGQSCQATVRFAPQAPGASSATLDVLTNDPTNPTITVSLSGTGATAAQGPPGPQGPQGLPGPPGPTGPQGPAAQIVCNNNLLSALVCFIAFPPGTWTVAGGTARDVVRAALVRNGHTVAVGSARVRHGQARVTWPRGLHVRPGRYTIVLATGTGRHRHVLLRRTVTIPKLRR